MRKIVCIKIVVAIAILCCALFAFDHFAYRDKIAVNGAVYTQKGENVTTLPASSMELGILRSITHRSVSNPTEDFTATNLDEKYAGCPIYQSGENNCIIYLEDYSGFYIPFELTEHRTQPEVVFVNDANTPVGSVSLTSARSTEVCLHADNSLLGRGESLGFQVDSYPVTVTVYGDIDGRQKLASCIIEEKPEGERWYVVARDGENGTVLEVGGQWLLPDEEKLRP